MALPNGHRRRFPQVGRHGARDIRSSSGRVTSRSVMVRPDRTDSWTAGLAHGPASDGSPHELDLVEALPAEGRAHRRLDRRPAALAQRPVRRAKHHVQAISAEARVGKVVEEARERHRWSEGRVRRPRTRLLTLCAVDHLQPARCPPHTTAGMLRGRRLCQSDQHVTGSSQVSRTEQKALCGSTSTVDLAAADDEALADVDRRPGSRWRPASCTRATKSWARLSSLSRFVVSRSPPIPGHRADVGEQVRPWHLLPEQRMEVSLGLVPAEPVESQAGLCGSK